MHHHLRVAAFACGLALAAGCGAPFSAYVLPAINAPPDTAGTTALVDVPTQTVTATPRDSTPTEADTVTAQLP